MKRIVLAIAMIALVFVLRDVQGTLLSSKLPGGKNYLDENNFEFRDNSIRSIDPIRVKRLTEYTITVPPTEVLENVMIYVSGDIDYIDGIPEENNCIQTDVISCTFTVANDDYIIIEIYSETAGLYYSYYQFDVFMLEEGNMSTEYEAYIAPLNDTSSPDFLNTGAYITDYKDTTSIEDIIMNHVTALDDVDGDISHLIVITGDSYTSNLGVVGEYNVSLEVSDSSSNKASFELLIIVKDEVPPVIEGPSVFDVDVNTIPYIDDILSALNIYDEYDGDIGYTITHDEYSVKTSIGSSLVSVEVIDSSGNITTKDLMIYINDFDAPVMTSDQVYNYPVEEVVTIVDVIDSINFSDNYESDIEILIITDLYSGNEHQVGTYFVDIELRDYTGNTSSYTLTINITDTIPPTLSGPTSLQYGYLSDVSIQDIKEMLIVSDNIDVLGINDIYIISDELSNSDLKTGVFEVVFGVVDGSGLETTYIVTVTLIDDQLPVIFVDDYIVKLNPSVTFGHEDALKLLRNSNQLEDREYEIKTLINEYDGNEKTPGMYVYQVEFTDDEGNKIIKDFVIEVLEQEENYTSLIISGLVISLTIIGIVVKKLK